MPQLGSATVQHRKRQRFMTDRQTDRQTNYLCIIIRFFLLPPKKKVMSVGPSVLLLKSYKETAIKQLFGVQEV